MSCSACASKKLLPPAFFSQGKSFAANQDIALSTIPPKDSLGADGVGYI